MHAILYPARYGLKGKASGIKTYLDGLGSSYVTIRNTMASNTPQVGMAELGELELTILLFVWRRGAMTAEQVREELGPPFDGSTVRAALRRLEDAGCVAHSVEGHTILYRPAEPRDRVLGRVGKPLQIRL
jgi:hypothetical protein